MQFTHRDGLKLSTALFNMFWKFRSTFHMQRIAVPVALVPILLIRSVLGDFVKVESRQIAFVQGVRSTLAPFCDYRWALHTWLVKWHLAWAWRAHASHSPSCIFQAEMKALMEGGVPWPSPVGGYAFESCPPRKVSARFDVILGAAALLSVSSALPSARYWTAREIRAVLRHNVMWDCRPGFCYHRGVHAADSAQLGGGYIKELSLLFPNICSRSVCPWMTESLLCRCVTCSQLRVRTEHLQSTLAHFCAKLSRPHIAADNFELWVQLGLKLEFHIAFPMAMEIFFFYYYFLWSVWNTFQSFALPPSKAVSGTSVSGCKVSALPLSPLVAEKRQNGTITPLHLT